MPRLIGPDEIAQAVAALRLDVPVYYGLQADDGRITLHLYGGPVVVWIPPLASEGKPAGLRPAMSTDMDVAAPTTKDAAGRQPAASGTRPHPRSPKKDKP